MRLIFRCAFIAGAVIFGAMAAIHSIRLSEVLIIEKTVGDKADWTYYLDGEEVACDNIDISNYKVSFDEEEHKVFLTSRSERGTLFFPVVVP